MQCACTVLLSVAYPAVLYFSTLSHKRHDFRRKVIECKMCVLIFSTTFIWNISHSKNSSARYDRKCTLVLTKSAHYSCRVLMKLEFSLNIFSKNAQISNFIKIEPVGAGLFHTDGQRDRHEEANGPFFAISRTRLKT